MISNAIYSFVSKHRYLLTISIVGLTLILLALTLMPARYLAQNRIFSYDKIGHLLMFGSWTFLLGLYHSVSTSARTNLWVVFFIGFSFGALIELIQYGLPFLKRHADIYDVVFDTAGCLLAVFVLKWIIPDE